MNRFLGIGCRSLVALGLTAAVLGAQRPEQTSDFRWSERIEAGRTVNVSSINGTVTLRAGSGDRVEVTAVKRWRRGDPASVKIYAAREGGDIRVCPLYEDRTDCDDNGRRTDVRRRDRDDNRDDDIQVDFTVLVPRGVHVVTGSVNGNVSVAGATEDVEAATVNGAVSITGATEDVNAATVNGDVTV